MRVGPPNSPFPSLLNSQVHEPIKRFLVPATLNSHSLASTPPKQTGYGLERERGTGDAPAAAPPVECQGSPSPSSRHRHLSLPMRIAWCSRRGTQISSSFSSCNSEPKRLLFELQSAIKQLLSELQFDIDAAPHRALIRFRPPFCVDHGRGSSPSRVQSARCSRRRKRSQYKLASRPDRKPTGLRRDQRFPSQVDGRLPSPATGGRQFLSHLGRSTRSHGERKSRRYAQQLA
ncbi:hypothetical protein VPH35_125030 [Triticum aestivum]